MTTGVQVNPLPRPLTSCQRAKFESFDQSTLSLGCLTFLQHTTGKLSILQVLSVNAQTGF